MSLSLGIDTGGTFTDAVLVDQETGRVIASAKALTTRQNLALGITAAIDGVLAEISGRGDVNSDIITMVALSTTLATNALAEGQRSAVCLLLIGYDPKLVEQYGFQRDLASDDVVYLSGGHDELGNQVEPLDEAAARMAIAARSGSVEAFAVSGYFGVRNPSHEIRVRDLVEELTGLPVTCGHELTSRLNSVRRATTVALNAHLIPPLRELIASVQRTLVSFGIDAPLMVVKGDGSLVLAEWALRRPIETILSGPAASAVGAWHLAGRPDVWAVDVGGTTTDIASLSGGRPALSLDGARVAGWRTMVEAVDVHTTGLGGDSHVRLDREGALVLGPRRVVPLCLLACEHPEVLAELRLQAAAPLEGRAADAVQFLTLDRSFGHAVPGADEELLDRLSSGPQAVERLTRQPRRGGVYRQRIAEMEEMALVRRSGFTPTDALHVLGVFRRWDAEAASFGAQVLAAQCGMDVESFCRRVVSAMSRRVASELVLKVLEDRLPSDHHHHSRTSHAWPRTGTGADALNRGLLELGLGEGESAELACALTLRRPLVAIGAPVAAYMPAVADQLHTELVIPPFAEVANAVGAVAGSVIQRVRALVNPTGGSGDVRLHLPSGVYDFAGLEAAVAYAGETLAPLAESLAREAGAEQVAVQSTRHDEIVMVGEPPQQLYLGTQLTYTATGRPRVARQ